MQILYIGTKIAAKKESAEFENKNKQKTDENLVIVKMGTRNSGRYSSTTYVGWHLSFIISLFIRCHTQTTCTAMGGKPI